MSRLIVDQDWESTDSPFTLAGTMARTSTNAIDGTDLRGGNGGAVDGSASYSLATADRPKSGSGSGFRFQAYFKFKQVVAASGGNPSVLSLIGPSSSLSCQMSGTVLRLAMGSDSASGTTALGTTAHTIEIEYREGPSNCQAKLYLDGVLELTLNVQIGRLGGLNSVNFGLSGGGGKITWDYVWGRMKVWVSRDAVAG